MEMLVTKFSNGKYRNEGELFAESISADIQPQRIRALGSGYGSIGTGEKQSMLCHARGEKDKILYSDKDTGQKGRNNGESGYRRAF